MALESTVDEKHDIDQLTKYNMVVTSYACEDEVCGALATFAAKFS